jgi:hypothetical protein
MAVTIIVQVPPTDLADLSELDETAPTAEARPFDGESMVQILYLLGPGTLTTLIAWIRARAASRKHFRIVVDGIEMNGYSAREAEQIISELSRLNEESAADGDRP